MIGRLKRYGFSLKEIKVLLECEDSRIFCAKLRQQAEKLRGQRRELELATGELLAHLRNMERTGDPMGYQKNYEIELKQAPDLWVITSRQMMGVKEFGNFYSGLYERMAKEHLTPDGVRGAVYYDDEFNPERSDIELVVGIREREKADQLRKGELCAMTVHKGSYSSLPDAYGALTAWIEEHGYAWDSAPFELYIKTQFDSLTPEEWETEVYFPVREKAGRKEDIA